VDRVDDHWAVVVYGIPAGLLVYAVATFELKGGHVFASRLKLVGDAAYSIYLTHTMSLVLAGRLWRAFGVPGWPAHLAFMAAAVAFGLFVGLLAYQRIEKPLMRFLRDFDPARRQLVTP
jgi:exopolysaccharide production protein ExoZ